MKVAWFFRRRIHTGFRYNVRLVCLGKCKNPRVLCGQRSAWEISRFCRGIVALLSCKAHPTSENATQAASFDVPEYCCVHHLPLRCWSKSASHLPTRCILYSACGKSPCCYERCWKWCPRLSVQAWTRLILIANTFCRSAFGKSLRNLDVTAQLTLSLLMSHICVCLKSSVNGTRKQTKQKIQIN
jgi:hypothetical protein